MVFPIAGGTQDTGAYEISNSLRCDIDSSGTLTKTNSSAGNQRTWTFSCWVKRSVLRSGGARTIFGTTDGESDSLRFQADGLNFFNNGTADSNLSTNRLFRDVSAWYHIVLAFDTTQGTAANRVKLYINGSQYTWDNATTYPDQNYQGQINDASNIQSLNKAHNAAELAGYIAEVHLTDGTAYAASDFGETNDNGVWVPKKASVSYGTNGYYFEFKQTGTNADASGIGADTSGNDNHYTVANFTATDVTTDTPTNNFATFNPLDNDTITGAASFSEGNLVINANSDAQSGCPTTIAVSNGAWYIEGKCLSSTFEIGVFGYGDGFSFNLANHPPYGDNGYPFAYNYGGDLTINNSNSQTSVGTFTTNDILAIALDMDNNTIKFFKNGSQVGSTITDSNLSTFAPYSFYVANHTASNTTMFSLNTGNPAFSISSGNTDGKYGNFEYAPPSGYYALCTKRLAEFG